MTTGLETDHIKKDEKKPVIEKPLLTTGDQVGV